MKILHDIVMWKLKKKHERDETDGTNVHIAGGGPNNGPLKYCPLTVDFIYHLPIMMPFTPQVDYDIKCALY